MNAHATILLGVALAAFAFRPLWHEVLLVVGVAALVAALALAAVEAWSPTACTCPCHADDEPVDEPIDELHVGKLRAGALDAKITLGPHVDVYASTDPEFTPGPDTLAGRVESFGTAIPTAALPVIAPAAAVPAARPYLDGRHRADRT